MARFLIHDTNTLNCFSPIQANKKYIKLGLRAKFHIFKGVEISDNWLDTQLIYSN